MQKEARGSRGSTENVTHTFLLRRGRTGGDRPNCQSSPRHLWTELGQGDRVGGWDHLLHLDRETQGSHIPIWVTSLNPRASAPVSKEANYESQAGAAWDTTERAPLEPPCYDVAPSPWLALGNPSPDTATGLAVWSMTCLPLSQPARLHAISLSVVRSSPL